VIALLNRRHDLQREFGLYESELSALYRRCLGPGVLAFDIGAADGLTSLIFANRGAKVVAFEPDEAAIAKFEANLELNPRLASRITLVAEEYRPPADLAPRFVKIDVDGGEVEVLHQIIGAPQCIVVETHSKTLERDCQDLLSIRGYGVQVVRNRWWRVIYPEYRPIGFNRWLIAVR
jgi:predicted nicotinamide N-methyase